MTANEEQVTVPQQGGALLAHVAGYVGHRTISIGLRRGLIAALADAGTASPDQLAERLQLDPFYVSVWCRAALSTGICDLDGDRTTGDAPTGLQAGYRLAPHVATLLLDAAHPGYVGGVFTVLEQQEVFDRFEASLASGERLWWDDCSPEWIAGVAATGTPFYLRLAPSGLGQIDALAERLAAGCRVVDTACGSGFGLVHLAGTYPNCELVGVDGDQHSLAAAQRRVDEAGVGGRCRLVHTSLEVMTLDQPATCVINNISMHECRDIDRVTENIRAALEPGGWFVISDFPYPDTLEQLRTTPGRVMSGIQFFEAQIDDQLLPRSAYDDLLVRHGFTDIAHVVLSPVHALTYGRAAGG